MDYNQQLRDAKEKLLELEREKLVIEQRMRAWLQIIEGLQTLTQDVPFDEDAPPGREEFGLTERVRDFLRSAAVPVGAKQIRDQLRAQGMDGSDSKNFLINVHTALARMRKAGEVEEVALPDGTKLYQYVTLLQRALKLPPPPPPLPSDTLARHLGELAKNQAKADALRHGFQPTPRVREKK